MKYKVINPMIYGGIAYNSGQEVEIFESDVAKSCIERGIIEKIAENAGNIDNNEGNNTGETEKNKKTAKK